MSNLRYTHIHVHVNKHMNTPRNSCIHMYAMYNAPVQMYIFAVSRVVVIQHNSCKLCLYSTTSGVVVYFALSLEMSLHVCILLNCFHIQFIEFELRSDA